MRRVAHVISTPSGVGGAERIVASLVRDAPAHGWEPVVVNPFARDPDNAELAAICAPATYIGRRCRSWPQVPGLWRWLRDTLGRLDPDVVHSHLFHAGVAVASLPSRSDRVSILTHHHGDHLVHDGRRYQRALDRWGGRRHERVVAISNYVRTFLVGTYGYAESRVTVIQNGWDGHPREHRGSGDRPTIACVANFRHQKGHSELLAAFALVRRELPAARLVLIGSGELEQELKNRADRTGIAAHVDFAGSSDDVFEALALADVFALASLYEPLGLAVIEAMAAGLPVVATAVGGVPELVRAETGILVQPGDHAAFAGALVKLLRNRETARDMGEAARREAQAMHVSRMSRKYFELYETLCR